MAADTRAAPLYGLVLAGGASTRMRRDKAALTYHGKPQLEWTWQLVSSMTEKTFVSARAEQARDPLRAAHPLIIDRLTGKGPIAGIAAAQDSHPEAAWLIVACDLPFLSRTTLEYLLAGRDTQKLATAYRSTYDGLPEPLCAIFEPTSRAPIARYIAAGKDCPRKFLSQSDVTLLDQPDQQALDNINTEDEFTRAQQALSARRAPASVRTINVQYYALLREQAGKSQEQVRTAAATPADLYAELSGRYPFRLTRAQLRVAVNAEFADWSAPLHDNDAVVFIPPVAGG